jgi:hypothetical protein
MTTPTPPTEPKYPAGLSENGQTDIVGQPILCAIRPIEQAQPSARIEADALENDWEGDAARRLAWPGDLAEAIAKLQVKMNSTLRYLDEQAAAHPVAVASAGEGEPGSCFNCGGKPGTTELCLRCELTASEARVNLLTGELGGLREQAQQRIASLEAETMTLTSERDTARMTQEELRAELVKAQANNHQRNLELDAVGYVWCSGTCKGTRRFTEGDITAEHVAAAMRNTERMLSNFVNRAGAAGEDKAIEAYRVRWDAAMASVSNGLLRLAEEELVKWQQSYANQKRCHCETERVLKSALAKRDAVVEAARALMDAAAEQQINDPPELYSALDEALSALDAAPEAGGAIK